MIPAVLHNETFEIERAKTKDLVFVLTLLPIISMHYKDKHAPGRGCRRSNRKAITGHLEPCLFCHGPVSRHWLRNFQERGKSIDSVLRRPVQHADFARTLPWKKNVIISAVSDLWSHWFWSRKLHFLSVQRQDSLLRSGNAVHFLEVWHLVTDIWRPGKQVWTRWNEDFCRCRGEAPASE